MAVRIAEIFKGIKFKHEHGWRGAASNSPISIDSYNVEMHSLTTNPLTKQPSNTIYRFASTQSPMAHCPHNFPSPQEEPHEHK